VDKLGMTQLRVFVPRRAKLPKGQAGLRVGWPEALRAPSTKEMETMAKYITLYKLTQQGIADIKSGPERVKKAVTAWEAMGGKMVGIYSTQGPYDYVAITEAPDEELAAAFALTLGAQGNVSTLTMRAFDMDEFESIVNKMP
jgi:uncharacterized protein with GYD domain